MPLSVGDPVPTVSAPNQHGETVTVGFDQPTVLYFYPRDDTPGCTTEAEQFSMELDAYRDAGVAVYGVSTDTVESHADFAEAHGIEFDLLADPDAEIAAAFDVEVDASRHAAARTTFVVVDGSVHAVYTGVDPDGHARDVLFDLLEAGVVTLDP